MPERSLQETYLNHPTFGLLYSLCPISQKEGLFTTLYAQRLFFRVTLNLLISEEMIFEPVSRNEARQTVEEQLRGLRRSGQRTELDALQTIYQRTFS
jgi:PII interaction protein X